MQHIRRKSVSDPRSWTAVKKFRLERGLNPALCDTGGVNELTLKPTGGRSFCGFVINPRVMNKSLSEHMTDV